MVNHIIYILQVKGQGILLFEEQMFYPQLLYTEKNLT